MTEKTARSLKSFFESVTLAKEQEFMSHVSAECQERVADPRQITVEELVCMTANSYERRLLYPKLDDAALVHTILLYMRNSTFKTLGRFETGSTYEEVLVGLLLPELLERFRCLSQKGVEP